MMKAIKKLTKKKNTTAKAKKKTAAKQVKAKKTPRTKTGTLSGTRKRSKKISSADFFTMVEKTAYELYVGRGYSHGADQGDWYEAEKIVKAKLSK